VKEKVEIVYKLL